MSDADPPTVDRAQAVANYKRILRTYIDRRPSGTRQKIALALGKHKSFVSQITNPGYASPVPAPHLNAIFEICHFSPEERKTFLGAYQVAHPKQRAVGRAEPSAEKTYELRIRLPILDDPKLQKELEATIRQTASRIIALVTRRQD
jgi:hypothetical protein